MQLTVGTAIIPSAEKSLLTITARFAMSGFMEGYPTAPLNTPVFTTMFSGQGIATQQLNSHFVPGTGYLYHFVSIRYDFQPAAGTRTSHTLLTRQGPPG